MLIPLVLLLVWVIITVSCVCGGVRVTGIVNVLDIILW